MSTSVAHENSSHACSMPSDPNDLDTCTSDFFGVDGDSDFVYLLALANPDRYKIGRSANPRERITFLKGIYSEIDLSRSMILRVDSRRIESVLHAVFETRGQEMPEKTDGYTEWFSGDIAEEVIDFCQRIAHHRGCQYQVKRGLEAAIEDYRRRSSAIRPERQCLNRMEKIEQSRRDEREICRRSVAQTRTFLDFLAERRLDCVLRDGDQYQLVRTVHRSAEPECWQHESGFWASLWSQRLHGVSLVSCVVGTGGGAFRLIDSVSFTALDDTTGMETIHLMWGPMAGRHSFHDVTLPRRLSLRMLWRELSSLPIQDKDQNNSSLSQ